MKLHSLSLLQREKISRTPIQTFLYVWANHLQRNEKVSYFKTTGNYFLLFKVTVFWSDWRAA